MNVQFQYDPYSPSGWDIEGVGSVNVGEMLFDDVNLIWLSLNEITLEPVSGDPMETTLEPVFWLSSKDLDYTLELSESELIPYLGD
jgi:hypothetical protein|tara:strand:+ start:192 stop:449 length:258 start_codon:yes stop_codon:yes gene_type:complete